VLVTVENTSVLCHRGRRENPARGPGLLPPRRALPGKDLRRRQDSRRLLQARGRPSEKETLTSRLIDRPDPSAVRRRLHERGAGGLHRHVRGQAHRSGYPRDDRHLRGAGDLRLPLQRPDRRCARRLQRGRGLPAQPDLRPARGQQAGHGRRRYGGRGADGRVGGRPADGRPDAGRRAVRAPGNAGRHQGHRGARCRGRQAELGLAAAGGQRGAARRRRSTGQGDLGEAYRITDKAERYARVGEIREACVAALAVEGGPERRRGQGLLQEGREEHRAQAHPRRRGAYRRSRHAAPCVPSPAKSTSCPRPTARPVHARRDPGHRRGDAGLDPRRADHRRPRRRASRSLHAALQLPALLGGRGRSYRLYRPSRSRPRPPGAPRPGRGAARRKRNSPTRSAWCRRSPSPTAPAPWPRSAWAPWR
jgi:hypothetical protein